MDYYSTGEVSKKLHISVRTLRYYDQVNLLKPKKLEDGTRLYTNKDLLELEKIKILKSASIKLEDIKTILNEKTTKEILLTYKKEIEAQQIFIQKAIKNLNSLLNILEINKEIDWDKLLPFVEVKDKNKHNPYLERWFTFDEQKILKNGLPKLEHNPEQIHDWITLLNEIELCFKNNMGPETNKGQEIAGNIIELSKMTFQGNKELENKFWNIRKSEKKSNELGLYPINKEILDFVEKAIHFHETKMMK